MFWKFIAMILAWFGKRKDAKIQVQAAEIQQKDDIIQTYEAQAEVNHRAGVIQQQAEDQIHELEQKVTAAPDPAAAAADVSHALDDFFVQPPQPTQSGG